MGSLEHDRALLAGLAEFYAMTPNALARRANVAATTINRPFNGSATTRLSQPTIDKLQRAFPAYPGWREFFGQNAADGEDDEEARFVALWRMLAPPDRQAILQLVRSLATSASSPALNDRQPEFRR